MAFSISIFGKPIRFPEITGTDNSPSVRQLEKRQLLGNRGVGRVGTDVAWTYQPSHELPDGFATPPLKDFMHEIR